MFNKLLGTWAAASLLLFSPSVVTLAAQVSTPQEQLNNGLVQEDETTNGERTNLTSSSSEIPTLESSSVESSAKPSESSTDVADKSSDTSQSTTQTTSSSDTTASSEKKVKIAAQAAATEVSTWADFVKALKDTSVSAIKVTADLTATSAGPTVTRAVDIDFDSHTLDTKKYAAITVNTPGALTIHNVQFTGVQGGFLASGTGTVTLTGTFTSPDENAARITAMEKGTVILDALKLNYNQVAYSSSDLAAISAGTFTITNGSTIVSNAQYFYYSGFQTSTRSQIVIDGQSKVTTNSLRDGTNTSGAIWNVEELSDIWIKGGSTLEMHGNAHNKADSNALFGISRASGSTLNVTEGSHVKAVSDTASAILMQSAGGSFNVGGQSNLDLVSNGDNSALEATLRFKVAGNMTFNVDGNSIIDITKTSDSGNTKNAPAIRMYGGSNKINVSGGSDFTVNRGVGNKVGDPGSDGNNQAIQYTSGNGNEFNLTDENSSVSISSSAGPAIDGSASDMNITAGKGTYFIARGNTQSATKGIFSGQLVNFSMDSIHYFDFRNNHVGGGLIFGNTDASSKFSSKNSDLAVWTAGSDLDGDPVHQWFDVTFGLSGANFANLDSTDNSQMQTQFGSLTNYSRMSANNQAAVLDEIRVPTNADKYIYAHASVPEGKDELRDAYTGEVQATIGVYDETGKEVTQVKGESIGDPLAVYGDAERKGIIKIDAPDKAFLKTGYTLKVLDAWRGVNDSGWIHQSSPDELTKDTPEVYDVTPADPVKLASGGDTVAPSAKEVTGTGEAGDILDVFLNGVNTGIETTVNEAGEFTAALPTGLKKGDFLQLFLRDHAGAAAVTNPPLTNDSVGNIEPATDMTYHDATFKEAKKVQVNGSLELVSVPDTVDFGTQKVGTKTETYYPNVSGKLAISDTRGDGKVPWELTLKETEGLHSDTNDLSGLLSYKNAQNTVQINQDNQVVETGSFDQDGLLTISDQWGEANHNNGLALTVPVGKQLLGDYKGTLSWTLENVPGNN
ncbi:Ig-like domain-containing protein [Enterococcus hulanensis]|uniref:pectate lyase-like adhesive domain-containing protein n=1 Tax=Enterococcus hulanensis TaxID=2559929 RepID=UPI00288E03FC|nr:pectate lyase-like adhesive domain-containing protein [Enterococcus hulanensis]MDT2660494.1 Ig-like domain-containing protein [Enterococcus hulanensis]